MTRNYEIVYIFDSSLDEAVIKEKLEKFHALLATDSVAEPVTNVEHWGKRTLAYPIKGKPTGYYVIAQFTTEPDKLTEFERIMKLEDGLVRHLIVIVDAADEEPESSDDDSDDSNDDDDSSSDRDDRGSDFRIRKIDYKNERTLYKYVTETGKMVPRRMSGATAQQQRKISTAIKRARFLSLLPYVKR